jgi:hypothetical protein
MVNAPYNPAPTRDTPADTVSAVLSADPAELARITAVAGTGVEHVVRRCLEKNPDERFQQISQNGGVQPRWSRAGSELFFLAPDGRLVSARSTVSSPIQVLVNWRAR